MNMTFQLPLFNFHFPTKYSKLLLLKCQTASVWKQNVDPRRKWYIIHPGFLRPEHTSSFWWVLNYAWTQHCSSGNVPRVITKYSIPFGIWELKFRSRSWCMLMPTSKMLYKVVHNQVPPQREKEDTYASIFLKKWNVGRQQQNPIFFFDFVVLTIQLSNQLGKQTKNKNTSLF